jgi:hypothetical protein
MDFEWDPRKDAVNQRKHGIGFPEAATVFEDVTKASDVINISGQSGTPVGGLVCSLLNVVSSVGGIVGSVANVVNLLSSLLGSLTGALGSATAGLGGVTGGAALHSATRSQLLAVA